MIKNAGWHPADIVAAVRKRGSNLRRLSIANGKAESTLRTALLKPRTPSNRIIAAFIGVPMHELWPRWFDKAGRLIARSDPAKPATPPTSPKRRAA
jgi:Ner family transcriptional regulator